MEQKVTLANRTKAFALRIIRLCGSLPRTLESQVLGKQLFRSGTSVGAHVREARRSRSDAEMISKYEVALQELDETLYWMELLAESEFSTNEDLPRLQKEADELISILVASVKTIKRKKQRT